MSRAYTVASLAAEWDCSEGVIRKAIANDELRCFRLGSLIRIPAEEVKRFECQNIRSNDCAEDLPSSGVTKPAGGADSPLKLPIAPRRKRRRAAGGSAALAQPLRLAE
jgi:excisionase family DNA binding protein